jgi:hypothetical protein
VILLSSGGVQRRKPIAPGFDTLPKKRGVSRA